MKTLIASVAVVVGVLGFGLMDEAKADYRTLHGVADIIAATGTVVNGGHSTYVVYDPYYPVYEPYYVPSYRYYGHPYRDHYYPRYRSYHCY